MPQPPGAAILRRVAPPLSAAIMGASIAGAVVVFAFLAWVLPLPDVPDDRHARSTNAIAVAAFVVASVPVGFLWSYVRARPVVDWLRAGRAPAGGEQIRTLRVPARLLVVQASLWSVGAAVFLALNLQYSTRLAFAVGITILLGGAVTCSLGYLLAERILRPVTELALARSVPDEPALPGVRARVLLAWALGTGAPVLGLLLVGGAQVVGISDESGDRLALERGVELGGEEREVAVLFVDMVGSTRLASERPPTEVVALLNEFFGAVVEVVAEHGGSINKFEGDAALCVFGAPLPHADAAGEALAAARSLCARLRAQLPQAGFGIGVSAGAAVAGNIGAAARFEYTVIGDPVNEAARLTELAKADGGRVLAASAALERAGADERARWEEGDRVTLRGRAGETRLARPL